MTLDNEHSEGRHTYLFKTVAGKLTHNNTIQALQAWAESRDVQVEVGTRGNWQAHNCKTHDRGLSLTTEGLAFARCMARSKTPMSTKDELLSGGYCWRTKQSPNRAMKS